MTQKPSYKQYPKEFKEEAVTLVAERLYRSESRRSLGRSNKYALPLERECREAKADITLSEDERTELKSLRQEVKTLRVEKEILKKARVDSTLSNATVSAMQYAPCAMSWALAHLHIMLG